MIIGKNSGQNSWEQQSLYTIIKHTPVLEHHLSRQIMDKTQEWDSREERREEYKRIEKLITKIKEIQEEVKVVLGKTQKEIKKYANRKRAKVDEYKVEDLVMLSTKDLKYQVVSKRTKKLTERFIGPYKIKKIISLNAVELKLPSTVKIHLVVNISRIQKYVEQVEG